MSGRGYSRTSSAAGPERAAVRGIEAVAQRLAEQQVAVLLVAADIAADTADSRYGIGSCPTELLVAGESAADRASPGGPRPAPGKDIDDQMVEDLRRMLSSAGYRPTR